MINTVLFNRVCKNIYNQIFLANVNGEHFYTMSMTDYRRNYHYVDFTDFSEVPTNLEEFVYYFIVDNPDFSVEAPSEIDLLAVLDNFDLSSEERSSFKKAIKKAYRYRKFKKYTTPLTCFCFEQMNLLKTKIERKITDMRDSLPRQYDDYMRKIVHDSEYFEKFVQYTSEISAIDERKRLLTVYKEQTEDSAKRYYFSSRPSVKPNPYLFVERPLKEKVKVQSAWKRTFKFMADCLIFCTVIGAALQVTNKVINNKFSLFNKEKFSLEDHSVQAKLNYHTMQYTNTMRKFF